MKKGIAEILEENTTISSRKKKVEHLQQNASKPLLDILKYAYDDNIKFLLPEGEPPYKKQELHDQQSVLYSEARRLYLFVEGGNPNLKQNKREMLFIQLLEMLDKKDAELIVAVKDKNIPYKGVTKKLIKEAFPDLINE